jgi:hypothetical protein
MKPSEWDAEFRSDLTGFLDDVIIDQAVDRGRTPTLEEYVVAKRAREAAVS